MALISIFLNCFTPSTSGQVSDHAEGSSQLKSPSSEKPKNKPKSKEAPLVVSYFPVNHYPSRL
uniref:Uncharacterized protein n=1 Tax=Cajanus cajan TaxID=3821 RepID=A0A151QNB4_CAJCA|nr:hypothetical protein KK1_048016 [Cajanus cajan]KYP31761.1 hypothetical protein KK1_047755 [Cajanus cajan]KYP31766.1 hypothetical protein KK1_047760 [Cajanus cajan]KYP35568.1 hypothetical protein KK1_043391 [Cajanus cajan]